MNNYEWIIKWTKNQIRYYKNYLKNNPDCQSKKEIKNDIKILESVLSTKG